MANSKKKVIGKKSFTKSKKKFVSSRKKSLSKEKVSLEITKSSTSNIEKKPSKKHKVKIRIRPNALEKTEEILTSKRQSLLEQLEEIESPLLVTLDSTEDTQAPLRINRYLARCGLGSRRDVEQLIREGKILVNGQIETNLTRKIDPQKDEVIFEGTRVTPLKQDTILVLNKPAGYLCSHFDVHHEKTVFNLLPPQFRRMNMAGRLDLNSRGLLIFTTDGNLIQELAHPSFGVTKTYHVILDRVPAEEILVQSFLRGVEEGGELLRAKEVRVLDRDKKLVEVILKEGRKRQIHRMFQVLGCKVLDLQRVQIGKLKLSDLNLKEGEYKLITKQDILGDST